eukprot:gene7168-7928_t
MQSMLFLLAVVVLLTITTTAFVLHPTGLLMQRQGQAVSSHVLAAKTHKVTIEKEGVETVVDCAEDTSVLDAAIDAGIDFPHDCKLGVCLTCPCQVVSGNVERTAGTLDESVVAKGYALGCMTFPQGDCKIRIIPEDEMLNAQFKTQV